MSSTRRGFLSKAAAVISSLGIGALAGCSSSCPDSGLPTTEEILRYDSQPVGPFETLPSGRWPSEGGDAANTGYAPHGLPTGELEIRWQRQLDIPTDDGVGTEASAPVVDDEQVYVADPVGVHALSLRTGEKRWERNGLQVTETEQSGTYRPATIAPRIGPTGHLLVGLETGLAALDPDDGTLRWEVDGLASVASPTVAGEYSIAQSEDQLVAVDADGTKQWQRTVERGYDRRQPAATDSTVCVQTKNGIDGFDVATGEDRFTFPERAESPPVIADGTCFVGTDEGLVGLDLQSGTEQFAYSRGDYMPFQSLVVTPETVYVVEQPPEAGASSFALDRVENGVEPRWCSYIGDGSVTAATDERALSLLSLGDGPSAERAVAAFTAERGAVSWAVGGGRRSDTWLNPPAVLDGALVLTTRGGLTFAVAGGDTP